MQNSNFSDNKLVHSFNNYPVHLVDTNGNPNPSAFIPFCDLGGNISVMGKKIIGLDMPVCNAFKEKFDNNKLCYELDVNQFKKRVDPKQILRNGLTFIVDTNENRQINRFQKNNIFTSNTSNIDKEWCFTFLFDIIFYSQLLSAR